MKRWKVDAYIVEVRELYARSAKSLPLTKFDGTNNVQDAVEAILAKRSKFQRVAQLQTAYELRLDTRKVGQITGFIDSGPFGFAEDVRDTNSGTVSHKKTKQESILEPQFFHMDLPARGTKGVLCIQRGLKGFMDLLIKEPFNEKYPQYRLHINNLVLADELNNYLKGNLVEEIIVEKHEIPSDIATELGGANRNYSGKLKMVIQPSDKNLFRRSGLLAYAQGKKSLDEVFGYDDMGFDSLKVKVRVGTGTKIVNITRSTGLSMNFDITDNLKFAASGYPTAVSIASEFESIVAELSKRGGILR